MFRAANAGPNSNSNLNPNSNLSYHSHPEHILKLPSDRAKEKANFLSQVLLLLLLFHTELLLSAKIDGN